MPDEIKFRIDYVNKKEHNVVLERICNGRTTGFCICDIEDLFNYPLDLYHHDTFAIQEYLKLKL